MAPELPASFTPASNGFMEGRSLLVVYGFYFSPTLPSGSSMERRAPAQSLSRDQCTRGPSTRNNTNTIAVQVLLMHLFHTLYTRYSGIAHHRALQTSGQGWADSKAVHGMECNGDAHALLEVSLSRGSCLMCTVLPVQEGVLSHTTEC